MHTKHSNTMYYYILRNTWTRILLILGRQTEILFKLVAINYHPQPVADLWLDFPYPRTPRETQSHSPSPKTPLNRRKKTVPLQMVCELLVALSKIGTLSLCYCINIEH